MSDFEREPADLTEPALFRALFAALREEARIDGLRRDAEAAMAAQGRRLIELGDARRAIEARIFACHQELRRRALAERLDPEEGA